MQRAAQPIDQAARRAGYLQAILASHNPRQLIVSGPGTGKTYTFGQLLRSRAPGRFLALTFIRKLVADMTSEFADIAEVKTFHAYCKMLLHQGFGSVVLAPYLTLVVQEDAQAMGLALTGFTDALQNLQEASSEVGYYLARGNYYRAVSFDDSVLRVYQAVRNGSLSFPSYDQIVIDEFQDFNPLEVSFINELQNAGPILIAGDDDQAVYSLRNSSPDYLREKYYSGDYELFQLPFCSRCPAVVVAAATGFVRSVVAAGGFTNRIPRDFVPHLEDKAYENATYPKILAATTANIRSTSTFLLRAIARIPPLDIADSREHSYPTVLVAGQRQYLNPIAKRLRQTYPYVSFAEAEPNPYSLIDAYTLLVENERSNLGWRVLAGSDLPCRALRNAIRGSAEGAPFPSLLPEEFIRKHVEVLGIVRSQLLGDEEQDRLRLLLPEASAQVIAHFFPTPEPEQAPDEPDQPTIMLSSFEGCKGLSAGHVFIVGLNEGEAPRRTPEGEIPDIEFCKFLVALTRARKRVHLLSNKWQYGPDSPPFPRSPFYGMIPQETLADGGYLNSNGIDAFLNQY